MLKFESIHEWILETGTESTPERSHSGSPRNNYGLRVPVIREYVKAALKEHQDANVSEWMALIDDLYQGEIFEERLMPGYFLSRLHDLRRNLPLARFDSWLGQLEGWAEVDNTCQSTFPPKDLIERWDEWRPFLVRLSQDANINKRRASLVLLRKPIADSPDTRFLELALENVERLKSEKDKLITKAVSWILREATKYHREEIKQYLDHNADTVPAIALRETRKKLETGTK